MTSITHFGTRTALVTGCAGFLGSHLSERLLADGWRVVGVDCFTDYYAKSLKRSNLAGLTQHPHFRLVELDLSVEPLEELVKGVDTVFHLAAQAGVRGSFGTSFEVYVRNNITATQRLLEATVQSDVETFVYASSSSVYGNPTVTPTPEHAVRHPVSPYGMTKVATEELAGVYSRTHGLRTVGLRYFTVYGPRQRPDMAFCKFITAALEDRPITVNGDGFQVRDFTFVDDIIDGTVAAAELELPGAHAYNLGGGNPVTLMEVVDMIGALNGKPLLVNCADRMLGDARTTGSDLALAAADLGYAPKVSLEEGLQEHFAAIARGYARYSRQGEDVVSASA